MLTSRCQCGYWTGEGTHNDGRPSYPISIVIDTTKGNNFTGSEVESEHNLNGPITSATIKGTVDGNIVSFTTTSFISGNQQILGKTYKGTYLNSEIHGNWTHPDGQNGGTFYIINRND